jgi:hypothetical protein
MIEVISNSRPRRFLVTITQLPVTRWQICHRTVAYRPGDLSEILTEHYRRATLTRSASLCSSRSRQPCLGGPTPTRDHLVAGLGRRTAAVTERGRSMGWAAHSPASL